MTRIVLVPNQPWRQRRWRALSGRTLALPLPTATVTIRLPFFVSFDIPNRDGFDGVLWSAFMDKLARSHIRTL